MTTQRGTTAVSWIEATQSAVKLAKDSAEALRQVQQFSEAEKSLRDLIEDLQASSQSATLARRFGWEGKAPTPQLIQSLKDAERTLDPRPVNRAIRDLENYSREVKAELVGVWQEYAAGHIGDVGDLLVLAATLATVEGVSTLSQDLQDTLGKLAESQHKLPTQNSIELLRHAEKALSRLEAALQPESVRQFLSAVASGGASVEVLTDEVLAWLKTHNANQSFRVVAGAPVGSR